MKYKQIRNVVKSVLENELHGLLYDVSYRIGVLQEEAKRLAGNPHKVTTSMLALASHQLDGYSITGDGTSRVTWTDCSISYKGTNYNIDNGNTTDKYVYWTLSTNNTKFSTSANKPTLGVDDVLICVNDAGKVQMVIGTGRMLPGGAILGSTVGTDELTNKAVTTAKINTGAVTAALLGANAVTTEKLNGGAVTGAKIAEGTIESINLGAGAVAAKNLTLAMHMLY